MDSKCMYTRERWNIVTRYIGKSNKSGHYPKPVNSQTMTWQYITSRRETHYSKRNVTVRVCVFQSRSQWSHCQQPKKTFGPLFTEHRVYVLPREIKAKHLTISNKCLESRNTTDKLIATSQKRWTSFNYKQFDGAFKKLDSLRSCSSWHLLGATNLTFCHLPLASKQSVSASFLFLYIHYTNCTLIGILRLWVAIHICHLFNNRLD